MSRPRKGRPKKKRASWALTPLIQFLNYTPGVTVDSRLNLILRSMKLEDIAPLQKQIIADLLPFTSPMASEKADGYLRTLCSKIDSFEFAMKLSPLRADKDLFVGEPNLVRRLITTDRKLFRWGKNCWIVNPYHPINLKEDSAEKIFYAFISAGLQDGELSMLRRCQQCQRFFIADEPRQIFCSPEHSRKYWDNPKRAKVRVYKSRELRN